MIITLCGSARFEREFHEWNKKLTLAGHVVFGMTTYPSIENGNKNWYTEDQKTWLDLIHYAKIMNSQGIVVINVEGYIGESTKKEIRWAKIINKHIYYIHSLDDDPFFDCNAKELLTP